MTLLQWSTEHLWGRRTAGAKAVEAALAVTFGRLLLPKPSWRAFPRLLVYAAFRFVFLSGDLPNHDLHHLGLGPWTEAPYVRSGMLARGGALRQTAGIRAMFRVAFDSARSVSPKPPRAMSAKQLLEM